MSTSWSKLARRAAWVWLIAAVCMLWPVRAGADVSPQDAAVARSLFTQGRKLLDAKNYTEACPKFEESQRLDPGIGTMFHLAVCYEGLGKTASAWSLYLEVARMAKAQNQPEKEQAARDRAAAIEPKLTQVTIAVPPDSRLPGLVIKRDASPIGQGMWGTPVPMDGGTHTVDAEAPGYRKWTQTFEVKPGGVAMTITVPKLVAGAGGATELPPQGATYPVAPPAVSTPQSAPSGPPVKRPPEMKRMTGLIIGGAVTLGVMWGVTAVVGVFGSANLTQEENPREYTLLMIPIVGPAAFAATQDPSSDMTPTLYIDSVLQAAGAAMLIAGLIIKRPVQPEGTVARAPNWFVAPTTMRGHGLGLQLNVTSF